MKSKKTKITTIRSSRKKGLLLSHTFETLSCSLYLNEIAHHIRQKLSNVNKVNPLDIFSDKTSGFSKINRFQFLNKTTASFT